MAKNWRRGRDYEHKVRNQLREQGFTVTRAAASGGPFDLIAIRPQDRVVKLIQCKKGYISEPAKERLREESKAFNGQFEVTFEVWHSP